MVVLNGILAWNSIGVIPRVDFWVLEWCFGILRVKIMINFALGIVIDRLTLWLGVGRSQSGVGHN